MRYRDSDTGDNSGSGSQERDSDRRHRRDTDLGEPSVTKRQARRQQREQEAARGERGIAGGEDAAGAPWDDRGAGNRRGNVTAGAPWDDRAAGNRRGNVTAGELWNSPDGAGVAPWDDRAAGDATGGAPWDDAGTGRRRKGKQERRNVEDGRQRGEGKSTRAAGEDDGQRGQNKRTQQAGEAGVSYAAGRGDVAQAAGEDGVEGATQLGADEDGRKGKVSGTFASVLSGNILSQKEVRRAYPYMIFVACLMFIYIANVFRTQYIYREHAALTEQVKELRSKSMTIASDKMKATRQSNIMRELERRQIPLKESLTPNKVIPREKPKYGRQEDDR